MPETCLVNLQEEEKGEQFVYAPYEEERLPAQKGGFKSLIEDPATFGGRMRQLFDEAALLELTDP